jgi:HEAT repeat protein
MLVNVIEKYLLLYKEAAQSKDRKLTWQINKDMIQEFKISPPPINEVIEELNKIILNPDYPGASLALRAIWSNLSGDYTPLLCQILDNELNQDFHEQIVEILDELADERAIPTLSKAVKYQWSYDEWLSIPKKSLQALAAIGTPEAITIIKDATKMPEDLISEHANMILGNIT